MRYLKLFKFMAAMLFLPVSSFAAPISSLSTDFGYKMPGSVRIGILGGYGMMMGEKDSEGANPKDQMGPGGLSGGLIAGFGSGTFSVEAGALFMKLPTVVKVEEFAEDKVTAAHRPLVGADYVGLPIWAKYNMIDRPLAVFFVKAGAIPLILLDQSVTEVTLQNGQRHSIPLEGQGALAVAGVGGTAPLGDSTAFILDISGFYGLTEPIEGSSQQGIMLSLGFSYDI